MEVHAEGQNFRIHKADGLVMCDVWHDADALHPAWAEQMVSELINLAAEPRANAFAMLLDLSDAPPVVRAQTSQLYAKLLAAWEGAGRRAAILVSDHPLQGLQLRRLAKDRSFHWVRVFDANTQAFAWASGE